MLELKYIDDTVIEANIIYDCYIPVIIKFKKNDRNSNIKNYMKEDIFYLEIKDNAEKESLIEIGIGKKTNTISEIVVTSVYGFKFNESKIKFKNTVEGWSVLDISKFSFEKEMYSMMYVDKIQTYLSNGKMEIVLKDIKRPLKAIKITDKFEIGVNDRLQIVYFVVKEITQNEYELLLETLQKS